MNIKLKDKRDFILKKKRAHYTIAFITDSNDDWFVHVSKFKKESKTPDKKSTIIRKDLDTWLNYYLSTGWEKIID